MVVEVADKVGVSETRAHAEAADEALRCMSQIIPGAGRGIVLAVEPSPSRALGGV